MIKKILIIDDVPDFFIQKLKDKGFEVTYKKSIETENIKKMIQGHTHILVRSSFSLNADLLNTAENIRMILRPGSGLDNIDLEQVKKKGIELINSPEGNKDAVGEHVLGLILALSKNIYKSFEEVKQNLWKREENRGFELKGKTLGIIGFGYTGSAVAEKVSGLNLKVLVYDKYKKVISNNYVNETDLNKLLAQSDIISLHIPLNEETKYMVDKQFIQKMKKGSYLINTSRGKIINSKVLLQAINSGQLSGAALDVLETEPPIQNSEYNIKVVNKLIQSGKVIITPHIAGWTKESKIKMYEYLLDKLN